MTKNLFVIFAAVLLLAVGCSRYIESRDPVRSLPDAVGTPYNLAARLNDQSVTLSWDIADPSTIARYRVYLSDSTAGNYIVRDSTTERQITIGGLSVNTRYLFRVASVLNTGLEGLPSEAVSVRIATLSLVIAGGDDFVKSRDVQIELNAPSGTTHYILSEDSLFGDAVWKDYRSYVSFKLSEDDGLKKVFGQLQFADGSQTGDLLSDEVTLDTRATIEEVNFTPTGVTLDVGDTVYFELVAGEADGEAFVYFTGDTVELYDDATHTDLVKDDSTYSGFFVVPSSFNLTNGLVTGSFTDAADNTADAVSATEFLTIFTPPQAVKLTAVAYSTYQIDLSWPSSASGYFSAYRIYRDNSSSVNDASSELVATITNRSTASYRDTTLSDATEYFYKLYVFDNTGLKAGSNVDSATTRVNTAPDPVEFYKTEQSDSTATFQWSISGEDDFESYRIFRGANVDVTITDQIVGLITNNATDEYTYSHQGTGTYFFRVFVFDRHGVSTGSVNSVLVSFTE
ncbi:MAG: fibronectin type III domain-containing protein [candidate division Zixibacteria bacterium]|nr:fibronectin type III domain-containing protein [candidate division Zixibacteria bacterium]